jgi:orotidine-5'-phosphate decarboxylase
MTNKIIVALDLPERPALLALAKRLVGEVGMIKVGLEAFVAYGPDLVRELRTMGHAIFLDLKLHDIPRTVAASVQQAAKLDVRLLTVHASGGAEMVRAAADAAGTTQIIAVTMLTSLDDAASKAIGFSFVEDSTLRLGKLARDNGAAGLVCSAHELHALMPLGGVRVVPGIRLEKSVDDQKRVATPSEALALGATWIVIGRPILQAADPVIKVREIVSFLNN